MEKETKAFVLLSGGIDSSTVLGVAKRDVGAGAVEAISIHYGQRHIVEIECAQRVAKYWGIKHTTLSMNGTAGVMLTDPNAEIPSVSYADIKGVSPTYVPFRNGKLISEIAAYAAHRINQYNSQEASNAKPTKWKGLIYFGAHAEDAANDAYPDCRLDFVGAMGAAVYIGTYHQVTLRAPLIQMTKSEIIRWGAELGIPYHLTWSCYAGRAVHCGVCPTCRARKEGFVLAGIVDPTHYAEV